MICLILLLLLGHNLKKVEVYPDMVEITINQILPFFMPVWQDIRSYQILVVIVPYHLIINLVLIPHLARIFISDEHLLRQINKTRFA